MKRLAWTGMLALVALAAAVPARAQAPPLSAPCEDAAPLLTSAERSYCVAIAQAVASAQPLLGILIAQGNPTPGAALPGGVRLRGLPRVSASVQLGAVHVRLPDIRRPATATAQIEAAAPTLSGTFAAELFPGFSASAGIGGIASLAVLGSGAWLPFDAVEARGLAVEAAEVAWGAGARLGLVRESFGVPAASVSLMYRRLARVRYGDVCPAGAGGELLAGSGRGYDFSAGVCAGTGDAGEFAFDLRGWSARAVVSKRVFGVGLAAGAGYDRHRSEVAFGFGATPTVPGLGAQPVYIRGAGLRLEQDRRSAFANAAFTVRIATIAAEAGWVEGGDAIAGYGTDSHAFDPARGALFGSLGVRLSF